MDLWEPACLLHGFHSMATGFLVLIEKKSLASTSRDTECRYATYLVQKAGQVQGSQSQTVLVAFVSNV